MNAQHGFEMDAVFLGMLCTNNSAKGIKTQLIKESTSQKPKPESQKTDESVATMNNPMANRSVPKIWCAQRNGNSLNTEEAPKITMALQKVTLPPLLPCGRFVCVCICAVMLHACMTTTRTKRTRHLFHNHSPSSAGSVPKGSYNGTGHSIAGDAAACPANPALRGINGVTSAICGLSPGGPA